MSLSLAGEPNFCPRAEFPSIRVDHSPAQLPNIFEEFLTPRDLYGEPDWDPAMGGGAMVSPDWPGPGGYWGLERDYPQTPLAGVEPGDRRYRLPTNLWPLYHMLQVPPRSEAYGTFNWLQTLMNHLQATENMWRRKGGQDHWRGN